MIQRQVRIALLWQDTLVREDVWRGGPALSLGTEAAVAFSLPPEAGVGARHELLVEEAGEAVLCVPQISGGEICAGGGRREPAAHETLSLGAGDWALLQLGEVAILVQEQAPALAPPRPSTVARMEPRTLGALFAAVALHMVLLVAAYGAWDDAPMVGGFELDNRFVSYVTEPPPPQPQEDAPLISAAEIDEALSEEEGHEAQLPGPPEQAETRPLDRVRRVGAVGALSGQALSRGPLRSVFGDRDGFTERLSVVQAGGQGQLVSHGQGDMGLRGVSGGGGGSFGRLHGMGGPPGGGAKPRGGRLRAKTRRKKEIVTRQGPGRVEGYCKATDITRVVENRRRGISACYERALARNPELAGKVTVSWRIGLDGRVMKVVIEDDTLRDQGVTGCVRRVVGRWRFPKPDGGMCQVRFPFIFSAGL